MMPPQALTSERLKQIAESPSSTSPESIVTIVMPTHSSGRETRQGAIRLGQLVGSAEDLLQGHSEHNGTKSDPSMLDSLRQLTKDDSFWQHQGDGLALIANGDSLDAFQLHGDVDEFVYVGTHPHLRRLAFDSSQLVSFYVLQLTWHEARLDLVQGNQWQPVESDQLPVTYDDLIVARDPEVQLQHATQQSIRQGQQGARAATFHGHGEGESKIEADRRNYLSRVSERVGSAMRGSDFPLVMVATDELVGHFRKMSDLSIAENISSSPESLDQKTLKHRCQEAMSDWPGDRVREQLERLGTAKAQEQGSSDLEGIVLAASRGRVDTLLLTDGSPQWGQLDHQQSKVQKHAERQPDSADLVNEAVVHAIRGGAEVVAVQPDAIGGGAELAAIYRY